MKHAKLMMTAPLLALLAGTSVTAWAQSQSYDDQSPAVEAAAPVPDIAASSTAPDINIQPVPAAIDKRMTARGMLGKPVYDQQNKRIATVEDVILDNQGKASLVVVKEHHFLNLGGKLAAFDYDAIVDRKPGGDVIMPITDKTISSAAEFVYTPSDKAGVRTIPANGYSLKKVVAGNLVDPDGRKLAAVDNVALHNGKATMLMVTYNQVLNMGGDKAALDFDATSPVHDKSDVNLMLGSADTQKFRDYTHTSE